VGTFPSSSFFLFVRRCGAVTVTVTVVLSVTWCLSTVPLLLSWGFGPVEAGLWVMTVP
jgi:hypothetical protein